MENKGKCHEIIKEKLFHSLKHKKWSAFVEVSVASIALGIIFSSWGVFVGVLAVLIVLITLKNSAFYFYAIFSLAWSGVAFYFALPITGQIMALILAILTFSLLISGYVFLTKQRK
ncbi:MAG: hypothetical protein KBT36_07980 [Kurthia sp.]|nr:hypothetical protein [Candidatus Kurthia equi]